MNREQIYNILENEMRPLDATLGVEKQVELDGLIDKASRVLEVLLSFSDKEAESSWLAGLLEGEGYFGRNGNCPNVALRMTDKDVVDTAATIMRGNVYSAPGRNDRCKTSYRVAVFSDTAIEVMNRILPHMHSRRRERVRELLEIATHPMPRKRRTHCRFGHELAGDNLDRSRRCKACRRKREREWRRQKSVAAGKSLPYRWSS